MNFPQTGLTSVPVFSSKCQKAGWMTAQYVGSGST